MFRSGQTVVAFLIFVLIEMVVASLQVTWKNGSPGLWKGD